jgi:hypothetical protein
MARKLKTFTTSGGFFDLAVAAPSMKAALEAWGAESNLFHQGFAKQTEDEEIIAATMATPGVVLRRPVGTTAAFSEHAQLPTHLGASDTTRAPPKPTLKKPHTPTKSSDNKTARDAALAFDREQNRRAQQALREEAAQKKVEERRDRAIAAAEAALEEGKRAHQANLADLEKAQEALDKRKDAEATRWRKQEEQLESALRRA